MVELFQSSKAHISEHISNIFTEADLKDSINLTSSEDQAQQKQIERIEVWKSYNTLWVR